MNNLIPETQQHLSPERQTLLAQRLRHRVDDRSRTVAPLPRDGKINCFDMSFAQQSMWFLNQLDPSSPLYNGSLAIRASGQLNIAVLGQALNRIVERHDTLRTTFDMVKGHEKQIIASDIFIPLQIIDLNNLPETHRKAEVQDLALQEAQKPFDLKKGPLLRVQIVYLDRAECVILITTHHIITDGWSVGILVHELTQLYQTISSGAPLSLSALPIQYADFSMWQREWLSGEELKKQLSYWLQQLGDNLSVLELPTDYPRPPIQTYKGAQQRFRLPADLSDALKAVARQERTTLFMLLLAAFKVLLHRYTGQEDILVGTAIAGRNRSELEGLIGLFVNTLALRSKLSGSSRFQALLSQVHETVLAAYAHQDVPFEKLIEELQPPRDMSHTPLVQVMFILQNMPMADLVLSGLTLSLSPVETKTAKFDLTLSMEETKTGLSGCLEYNTDLFKAETITRLLGHFQILLAAIVADPGCRLADLPILTKAEEHQLLVQWNKTQQNYVRGKCVHHLFEEQVERTPEAIAVVLNEQHLTYRELNRRANQLAHHLQTLGVAPDVLVGICLERSLETIIGILGVLKAGGGYVPLDPKYPQERLAYILEETQATILLTQEEIIPKLPNCQLHILCLDTQWIHLDTSMDTNPERQHNVDNLLYVIYTSGSTGKPKGVNLSHRSLFNLVQWFFQILPQSRRVLQFAPLSFDASFSELLIALGRGSTLFMVTEDLRLEFDNLIKFLHKHRIQMLILPVIVLQRLAEICQEKVELLASLQVIIATGEQLQITPPIVDMFKYLDSCSLHNHYGPSETHVVTSWAMPKDPGSWPIFPTIGQPIANSEIYLLDNHGNPVPIGIAGEIYIGGVQLARGYLFQPSLTAERFIPHLYNKNAGERLYRTGDLARYLPDGNIEFLGRIDDQVKVRGYRVELKEIERELRGHPAVGECAVVLRTDSPSNKGLVGYVIAKGKEEINREELHDYLAAKLPEYMIPSVFVTLGTLPLTHNGKLNRNDLPFPEYSDHTSTTLYVAPRTNLEQLIADIWCEFLGLDRIGIHDNFFTLGGHSLLATRIISSIRDIFSVDLPLKLIFESPTIEKLAFALTSDGRKSNTDMLPQITSKTDRGRYIELLASLDQLSDAEVDSILSNILLEDEAINESLI